MSITPDKIYGGMVAKKPQKSYTELLCDALASAPERAMYLHEIYDYLTRKYRYFRDATDGGWKVY